MELQTRNLNKQNFMTERSTNMNIIKTLNEVLEQTRQESLPFASNLFIIGNGFDLAHKLPTSYEDFHDFLRCNYPKANVIEPSFDIEGTPQPDGSVHYDDNEVVAFLLALISEAEKDGDNWSDVEHSLGLLDFQMFLDDIAILHDNEDNPRRLANIYEDVTSNFYIPTTKIKKLFAEWVNSIVIPNNISKKNLSEFMDLEKDWFLSFNYTNILENVYGTNNVLHIHNSQTENELKFGHGANHRKFEHYHIASQDGLRKIHQSLRKNTDEIIKNNKLFFENLASAKNIRNIYSFGFSFSKVDLPYIQKICENMKTENIVWNLSDYECDESKENFKSRIEESGFKGKFAEFKLI